MLHKFRTKSEVTGLPEFPDSVILEAERITAVLDTCYNRFGYDGGYVLIAENITDLQEVKAHHIDYKVEANLKIALPDTEGFTLTRTVNRQFLPTVNKK